MMGCAAGTVPTRDGRWRETMWQRDRFITKLILPDLVAVVNSWFLFVSFKQLFDFKEISVIRL